MTWTAFVPNFLLRPAEEILIQRIAEAIAQIKVLMLPALFLLALVMIAIALWSDIIIEKAKEFLLVSCKMTIASVTSLLKTCYFALWVGTFWIGYKLNFSYVEHALNLMYLMAIRHVFKYIYIPALLNDKAEASKASLEKIKLLIIIMIISSSVLYLLNGAFVKVLKNIIQQ